MIRRALAEGTAEPRKRKAGLPKAQQKPPKKPKAERADKKPSMFPPQTVACLPFARIERVGCLPFARIERVGACFSPAFSV